MAMTSDPARSGATDPPKSVARQFFELFGGGPLPNGEEFDAVTETVTAVAGETIFDRGDDNHHLVYVVLNGAVKILAADAFGAEHLVGLARVGELVASIRALAPEGLSRFVDEDLLGADWSVTDRMGTTDTRAVAITDVTLQRIDFQVVHARMQEHGGTWAVAVFNAAMHYAMVEEHRTRQFLMLTAEDRYRHFLRRYPDLVGVLPQKDIGSYVGVTPVGISRIASRVREENRRRNGR
ncbi:MAG: Crp/Fnr family transcriptional regulator [Actinomycetales bacterium]|nr:Crp/Fnr family transcriptional regulator [Candidatus Phosphoribacter baldrii]